MKAKTAIWHSANGRQTSIRDMETEHLQNLAAYLQRRCDEHDSLVEMAKSRDLAIAPPTIRGELVIDWLLVIITELSRRRRKSIDAAQKVLIQNQRTN